jgi:hypothetical protein
MAIGWLIGSKLTMMNKTEVGVKVPQSGTILAKQLSDMGWNA